MPVEGYYRRLTGRVGVAPPVIRGGRVTDGVLAVNLDADLVPVAVAWPLLVLFVLGLAPVLRKAPWGLLRDNRLESVFIGAVGCVGLLWSMSVGVRPGLELHLLGATALTLIFGWRLAIAAGLAALAALSILGLYAWPAFAVNGLLLAVLPVLVSHWIGRRVYGLLPHHFFVYIFLTAFFGAMLAMGAVVLTSAALLFLLDAYPYAVLVQDYLVMLPLIMFPEGFITGMVMTMLVVFRPEWVRTFDDRDYIHGK
ncbi:MAG: energy-coupling factor ABC transporter permease [Ectothiorhodospiraceae bacterium]|nr:energy-coupling factor ABC transporter permease [Ectothiorhodospiraceae bacterium]